jgi:hypothetical protein
MCNIKTRRQSILFPRRVIGQHLGNRVDQLAGGVRIDEATKLTV